MKKIFIVAILLLISNIANAEWISGDSVNDPEKEKICLSRIDRKGPRSPFEIDSDYVERSRKIWPEATFVVIGGTMHECFIADTTGQFGLRAMTPPNDNWHLILPKIKKFEPGIDTSQGRSIAWDMCVKAYQNKSNKNNYDHTFMDNITESVFYETFVPTFYSKGKNKIKHNLIAGKKVEKYDVVVQGKVFYGPANPDFTAVHIACLLSPMFEFKAIQYEW
ncbi:MAG TPA: hypothetical protein PK160_01925 [Bacillota bacterium]|nr:hypothetical protein [Bacillota bacterium]